MQTQWMKAKTAAAYADVNPDTIRNWIAGRGLRTYRIGRCVRINRDELDEFIKQHRGGADVDELLEGL